MRTPTLPLTVRRMGAYRLLLAAVAAATVVTAALVAALAGFAGQALSQAGHRQLVTSSGTSVSFNNQITGSEVAGQTRAVRTALRSAFAGIPYRFDQGTWSDPLALPARYRTGATPVTEAAALSGVSGHARLTVGHWPAAPAPGQPVQAAVTVSAARLLKLAPGTRLDLRDQETGRPVTIVITGVFQPATSGIAGAQYWSGLDLLPASGLSDVGGFATYGPLVTSQAALGHQLTIAQASWVARPDLSTIGAAQLRPVASRLSAAVQRLRDANTTSEMLASTRLPALLDTISANLVVARSLLAICAVLLLVLAAVALTGTARLLAAGREGEAALLAARGGSRWQLVRLSTAEAVTVAVAASLAGGVAGGALAGVLARSGPLRAAHLRVSLLNWPVWAVIAAVALLAALITLRPALRRIAPGEARVRSGRQAALATAARGGVDLCLLALGGLAVWQLHRTLLVSPSASGTLGVDPVLTVAPALALIGGTVVLLRLLPLAARAGERLAARGRRLILAGAAWELSRHPARQAGVALLVVLSVATGTLALAAHASWQRSAHDQAAFAAGADVRLDTAAPVALSRAGAVPAVAGMGHAMPVAPVPPGDGPAQVLALDAAQAPGVVLLRRDLSPLPERALFARITPRQPAAGVVLAGHPAAVAVTASLGPASLHLAPAQVQVFVQDADGNIYSAGGGTLPGDGRAHRLTVSLGPPGHAVYPLRLAGLDVTYTLPPRQPRVPAVLAVPSAGTGAGVAGTALAGWTTSVSSGQYTSLDAQDAKGLAGHKGAPPGPLTWRAGQGGAQALTFRSGFGRAAVPPPGTGPPTPILGQLLLTAGTPPLAVPGIATQSYLRAQHAGLGSTVQMDIGGLPVPVRIVAAVRDFPTVPADGQEMIVDLGTAQRYLLSRGVDPLPVTQWWLSAADPGAVAAALPGGGSVTTVAARSATVTGDPESAVPQQALIALAVAAMLLAIVGFCVSIAASVAQRRPQSALLSALGVPRRAQAGQLCLEELMISLPAAVVGLALGALIAGLLVPAITLTADATAPVPSALTVTPWALVVPLALAVTVLPVVLAALSGLRGQDPAARLRVPESV